MKFQPTPLTGSYLIELEKIEDERGFFSRLFCADAFREHGLDSNFIQINNSYSQQSGTLRGMHFQVAPKEEVKLVRCIQGSLWDVILDLRKDSKTYGQSFGAKLSAENRAMMYVPKGFAHGFMTLEDKTELLYFVTENYSKECERAVRYNDPKFNICWPANPSVISERDRNA